jgi:hypothetical protein
MDRKSYQREWMRKRHGHAEQKRIPEEQIALIRKLLALSEKQIYIALVVGCSQHFVSQVKMRMKRCSQREKCQSAISCVE